MRFQLLPVVVVISLLVSGCQALNNGLALTPPMGFLSWERFRCDTDCAEDAQDCISENLYKSIADAMVEGGFLEAGYEFVNIDDCWLASERDANGRLQSDPDRFPSGISSLADYVHGLGLKLGIYEDFGTTTCAGYPGSYGHLQEDAQTFADWHVDYLKFDGCNVDIDEMPTGYTQMAQYLNETGRPIVFSCEWPLYWTIAGLDPDYEAIRQACNLWRNWYDIDDTWDSVSSVIDHFGDNQDEFIPYAGPGGWNDPDMIVVGDFGLSYDESQVQMAIWSILASPLLVSADVRNIKQEFKDILLNRDVIAINQDPLGIQGRRIYQGGDGVEIWIRPVTPVSTANDYSYAVAIRDRGTGNLNHVTTTLGALGLTYASGYSVVDLYNGDDFGVLLPDDELSVTVNPSGVIFLKATIRTEVRN